MPPGRRGATDVLVRPAGQDYYTFYRAQGLTDEQIAEIRRRVNNYKRRVGVTAADAEQQAVQEVTGYQATPNPQGYRTVQDYRDATPAAGLQPSNAFEAQIQAAAAGQVGPDPSQRVADAPAPDIPQRGEDEGGGRGLFGGNYPRGEERTFTTNPEFERPAEVAAQEAVPPPDDTQPSTTTASAVALDDIPLYQNLIERGVDPDRAVDFVLGRINDLRSTFEGRDPTPPVGLRDELETVGLGHLVGQGLTPIIDALRSTEVGIYNRLGDANVDPGQPRPAPPPPDPPRRTTFQATTAGPAVTFADPEGSGGSDLARVLGRQGNPLVDQLNAVKASSLLSETERLELESLEAALRAGEPTYRGIGRNGEIVEKSTAVGLSSFQDLVSGREAEQAAAREEALGAAAGTAVQDGPSVQERENAFAQVFEAAINRYHDNKVPITPDLVQSVALAAARQVGLTREEIPFEFVEPVRIAFFGDTPQHEFYESVIGAPQPLGQRQTIAQPDDELATGVGGALIPQTVINKAQGVQTGRGIIRAQIAAGTLTPEEARARFDSIVQAAGSVLDVAGIDQEQVDSLFSTLATLSPEQQAGYVNEWLDQAQRSANTRIQLEREGARQREARLRAQADLDASIEQARARWRQNLIGQAEYLPPTTPGARVGGADIVESLLSGVGAPSAGFAPVGGAIPVPDFAAQFAPTQEAINALPAPPPLFDPGTVAA